ncbi:penicillin-binding protein 1C [Vibrio nitrifigilis]|uniref:peptidoglycan glycosyltransferase n=1 Tax=Vibrio nitrifigilis TaxID=2789781 RepID=A0ABS0GMA0_9VIBR|nr:penicillin-binding protein 1C [Vibrio nitrifigilis]MBF9003587.1 penicillin-binding protein 1C [Vibrio nitrifigilis]
MIPTWFKRVTQIAVGSILSAAMLWGVLNVFFPLNLTQHTDHSVTVYASDGNVLRQFASSKGIYRIPITHEHVSHWYIDSLLEYEDKYFFHHIGVNPFALVRAAAQRLYYGHIISGGSTLTMQVARLFYPHPRTYFGKIEQMFRALQLEAHYSKEQILNFYLTYAPMGGNIEGVEAASQRYFAKHASELSPTEAATLVALPQKPSVYRPDRYPQRAISARNKVLERVAPSLSISPKMLVLLMQTPMTAYRRPVPLHAPLLARELKQHWPLEHDIHTFIRFTLQNDVENILSQYTRRWSAPLSASVIIMDSHTGHVLAYKGSADLNDAARFGYVDMTKAWRSPGSTLKPFIYGLAIDKGLVTSGSLMSDVPRSFDGYRPQNFDRRFNGAMRLDTALQKSQNIPAVQTFNALGPDTFMQALKQANIKLLVDKPNLAMALGGEGARLIDLVSLYSALANGGKVVSPRFTANDVQHSPPLLSPQSSWIIHSILEKIAPPDRVKAAHSRHIAWKTGTSYGYRDAWAIGTSYQYTVGVWVGRPDGAPYVGQTGANQAGPLLFDIFDMLPAEDKALPKPEHVTQETICWPSGLDSALVKDNDCKQKQHVWTIDHRTPPTLRQDSGWDHLHQWPQSLVNWSKKTGRDIIDRSQPAKTRHIAILSPTNHSQIFSYPGQQLPLTASEDTVSWYIDDQAITSNQLSLDAITKGTHKISACHDTCASIEVTVY